MLLTVFMSAKRGIRVAALALALWLTADVPAQRPLHQLHLLTIVNGSRLTGFARPIGRLVTVARWMRFST
ncbi:MAG: hypothetical protein NTW03_08035 [Verrucomicrobia bacterium]|nr:hypothetical protein [Verrucomicrobiota bacterium]